MAVNPKSTKYIDPELNKIQDQIDAIPSNIGNINVPPENEYLTKAQKKFAAVEWEQQIYFQLFCAKQPFIIIDNVTYNNQTVGHVAEVEMSDKYAIWERLFLSYQFNIARAFITEKDMQDTKKLAEFDQRIKDMKKIVDEADSENLAVCAFHFYGIPRDIALANKEMLLPYIIGRKYYHQKAFVGKSLDDIKRGKATLAKNGLETIFSGLTKDHY